MSGFVRDWKWRAVVAPQEGTARYCFASVLVVISCSGCGLLSRQQVLDFSDFNQFRFERTIAFEECVGVGDVLAAEITKSHDGEYIGNIDLLTAVLANGEFERQTIEVGVLTEDEVNDMLDLFRLVSVSFGWDPNCFGPITLCELSYFSWDEFEASDFVCNGPIADISESDAAAIVTFLKTVASAR